VLVSGLFPPRTIPPVNTARRPVVTVLVFAALIVGVSMGIRHTFGFFLGPMTRDLGWTRELFGFAIAVQNLMWGACQPFAGLLADRYGARRVLWAGSLIYVCGLVGMAYSSTGTGLTATAGLLIGMAQSGVTYAVVFSAIGRLVPAERRSWSMGVVAASGSFGQFLMVPAMSGLINGIGWFGTLLIMAGLAFTIVPLGAALTRGLGPSSAAGAGQSVREALREAFGERSFLLLTAGYFVCGFQLAFIGIHGPTYMADKGLPAYVAPITLALVGLFNIFGTYASGHLATRFPKRYVLSGIYFSRSVAIVLFLAAPVSPWATYLFGAAMGVLWLSTIPPTSSIIAQVFGVRYLGMLTGFAFFSHQMGSFLGVWLGGRLFDATGSYDVVWGLCIALGVFAALVNLPIDERSIESRRLAPAA
jgi:MFS family permease